MKIVAGLLAFSTACAGLNLNNLLQPPSFSVAAGRTAELRLVSGGAGVRLWAHVQNPHMFGTTPSLVH
jgi:hypothetical protein